MSDAEPKKYRRAKQLRKSFRCPIFWVSVNGRFSAAVNAPGLRFDIEPKWLLNDLPYPVSVFRSGDKGRTYQGIAR